MAIACLAIIIGCILIFLYHHQTPLASIFVEDTHRIEALSSGEKGAVGEEVIYDFFQTLPGNYIIFQNIYLPLKNGKGHTEVDLIVVHEKGVFVIESKNYEGIITGESTARQWSKKLSSTFSKTFYNPIMQNATHISALQHAIPMIEDDELYSIIIFGQQSELQVELMPAKNVFVMKATQAAAIYDILAASSAQLPYVEIADELKKYHSNDWKMKMTHTARLKMKYSRRVIS